MIGHVKPSAGVIHTLGNPWGSPVIFLQGSCRTLPYVNYFNRLLEMGAASLRVFCVNPDDHHWDDAWQVVPDFYEALRARESDPNMLAALKATNIFIHEHYANYDMFNTAAGMEKNIFQFGMAPQVDICLPNFHDLLILYNDIKTFDASVAAQIESDGGVPSEATLQRIKLIGEASVEKFCGVCRLSSFPEMEEYFRENWRTRRFFWTMNHISRHFSLYLFRLMNDKFLHLNLSDEFWHEAGGEDLFCTPCTEVVDYDRQIHGLTWQDV